MSKQLKQLTEWLSEMQEAFTEEPMFNTKDITKERTEEEKLWELGSKAEPKDEEEIEFTCCGDEITGDVEDVGLCPTCFEHI